MASLFTELCIDCKNPRQLAQFWQEVLDYAVISEDEDLVSIGSSVAAPPSGGSNSMPVTLTFARVPEGKVVKNRLHMDLRPQGTKQKTEVERLLSLGASLVDVGQGESEWVVIADPEGNEFCVLAQLS